MSKTNFAKSVQEIDIKHNIYTSAAFERSIVAVYISCCKINEELFGKK